MAQADAEVPLVAPDPLNPALHRPVLERLRNELKKVPAPPHAPLESLSAAELEAFPGCLVKLRDLLLVHQSMLADLQAQLLPETELGAAAGMASPHKHLQFPLDDARWENLFADDRWRRLMRDRTPLAVHLLLAAGLGFTDHPEADALDDMKELIEGMLLGLDAEVGTEVLGKKLRLPADRLEHVFSVLLDHRWRADIPHVLACMAKKPMTVDELVVAANYPKRTLQDLLLKHVDPLKLRRVESGKSPKLWWLTQAGRDVVSVWKYVMTR